MKSNIAAHLKSAATNGTEDVVKFSPSAFNKALDSIGDRKLAAFLLKAEVDQLRAIGRAGTLMEAQPKGSAVNNSNSGTFIAAKALEFIDMLAGKALLGMDKMIQGTIQGVQQGQALNVPRALLRTPPPMSAWAFWCASSGL